MFPFLNKKNINIRIEELIFVLCIQLYIFRTMVPIFKYLFSALFIGIFIYKILSEKFNIIREIPSFIKHFWSIIILLIMMLLGLTLSHKLYPIIVKDIANVILLLLQFYLIFLSSRKKFQFKVFYKYFNYSIIFFAIFITSISFLKQLGISGNSIDRELKIDYNFQLLPIFFGIVSVFSFLAENNLKTSTKVLLNIILTFFTFNIVIAGSRRGILLLVVIIVFVIISQVPIKKDFVLYRIGKQIKLYIFLFMFFVIGIYVFSFKISCFYQNRILDSIGTKDVLKTKSILMLKVYRYAHIFSSQLKFNEFYEDTYLRDYDPRDPGCGWGIKYFKRIDKIEGENSHIVPKEAMGAFINQSIIEQNNKLYKNLLTKIVKTQNQENINVSVYCYVSNDFNGYKVFWRVNPKNLQNPKQLKLQKSSHYDLTQKGTWQKIELDFIPNKNDVPVYLRVISDSSYTFTGYVVLAYPNYNNQVDTTKKDAFAVLSSKDKLYFAGILGSESGLIKKIIPAQKTNISTKIQTLPDTNYYPLSENIIIDTIHTKFAGPRINRWRFAFQVFSKEYSLPEKLIGGGYKYLNWFGNFFYKDKSKTDWPHSPFLSVLLYSGILGLSFFLYVIFIAFRYYLRFFKQSYLMFAYFLITFSFAFFSSNSPFTPPIFGFFLIFPFFMNSILQKKTENA